MASPVEDVEAAEELTSVAGYSEQQLASDSILHSDIPPSSKQLQKEKSPSEEGTREDKEGTEKNKVKSSLVMSGVMIAVIGAMVAIIKKMRNA